MPLCERFNKGIVIYLLAAKNLITGSEQIRCYYKKIDQNRQNYKAWFFNGLFD